MKYTINRKKKIYSLLILFLVLISCPPKCEAQNPSMLLDNNHSSVYLLPGLSKLKHDKGEEYLISPLSFDLSIGYNYIYSLGGFYGIGFGATIGYLNYKIEPNNSSGSLYSTSQRIMNLNTPVYINKYYPFNNRISIIVKAGLNLSTIFTSFANFGSVAVDGNILYSTNGTLKAIPQVGILFEIGGTYSLSSNNFLSLGIFINKNFINVIQLNYEYFEDEVEAPNTGSFESTASSFGISLRYNFKTFLNDAN